MKLYIVSTDDYGFSEFDSHVIAANTEDEAKSLANLPGSEASWKVEEIGTSPRITAGVIHSSFNAG